MSPAFEWDEVITFSVPMMRPPMFQKIGTHNRIVIMKRSKVHAVYSAWNRFDKRYNRSVKYTLNLYTLAMNRLRCVRHAMRFDYEDLVADKDKAMKELSGYLSRKVELYHTIKIENRNDNRWKEDGSFVEQWNSLTT